MVLALDPLAALPLLTLGTLIVPALAVVAREVHDPFRALTAALLARNPRGVVQDLGELTQAGRALERLPRLGILPTREHEVAGQDRALEGLRELGVVVVAQHRHRHANRRDAVAQRTTLLVVLVLVPMLLAVLVLVTVLVPVFGMAGEALGELGNPTRLAGLVVFAQPARGTAQRARLFGATRRLAADALGLLILAAFERQLEGVNAVLEHVDRVAAVGVLERAHGEAHDLEPLLDDLPLAPRLAAGMLDTLDLLLESTDQAGIRLLLPQDLHGLA